MNLMYFKNLRGDRDGGTTGLISRAPRYRGGIDSAGGAGSATSYGGGGVGGGANSRNWFAGGAGVGYTLSRSTPATSLGIGGVAAAPTADPSAHLLMDRGGDDDRASSAASAARWNNCTLASEASRGGDYRYHRVARGDSSVESTAVGGGSSGVSGVAGGSGAGSGGGSAGSAAGGSRSVRSGLYDTEVCLSVSGLGNVRGTMVSGRTGKQVSYFRLFIHPSVYLSIY